MDQRLTFDPTLPDLALIFDTNAVARIFQQPSPYAAADHQRAPVDITHCRLQDVKYQPGTRCVATYELRMKNRGAAPRQTIGVVSITSEGVATRLFADDPELPWLAKCSPAELRARLAGLLSSSAGTAVESCTVTPVRYRPGARCVLRIDLQTTEGNCVLFGKLLGEGAAALHATLETLYQTSREHPAMPRILRPLVYWDELHLLLQPAVSGAELNHLAFNPAEPIERRKQLLTDAGRRLAGLHTFATAPGALRSFGDEVHELRSYLPPLQQARPALAVRYSAAIDELERTAGLHQEPQFLAGHGAFRTDQFLVDDDRLIMIDLDTYCWANPARDIGNFLAYLHWKAVRGPHHAELIDLAADCFLAGYSALRPATLEPWPTLYQALSALKIAGRRFRSLTIKEWPLVPRLIDHAQALLARL